MKQLNLSLKNQKNKLQKLLSSVKTDAILISYLPNVRYFSNFTGTSGYIIATKKQKIFLTDNRYKLQIKKELPYFFKQLIYENELIKTITNLLVDLKIKTLGIEYEKISYKFYTDLKKNLKGIQFIDITKNIQNLRIIKEQVEIRNIKKALKISEKSFKSMLNRIKPGIKEIDIRVELEYLMQRNGCENISFPTIVAAGERIALPHAKASKRKIKTGELILVDFGCSYNGYNCDLTRLFSFGEIKDNFCKKLVNDIKETTKYALGLFFREKDGKKIAENVDRFIKSRGYKDGLIHSLGHGIGLEVHELPVINIKKRFELKPGMVFTVEPGIYIENKCGARIEHDILYEKDGIKVLDSLNVYYKL